MAKVYKMPILYSFYNNGNIRLQVPEDEVLTCWKDFFDRNKNWRDFSDGITYEEYKGMTDKQHLAKAKTMPIKFLKASGIGSRFLVLVCIYIFFDVFCAFYTNI